MFCQLIKRRYKALKVPRDSEPVFEFDLADNEHFVGIEHYWSTDRSHRKTVDHFIRVWVRCEFLKAES